MKGTLAERMAHYTIPEPMSGCSLWMGSLTNGYGYIQVNGTPTPAHRVAYEAEKGAIPPGLQIDHLCRNRACVNPFHPEAVSNQENTIRAYAVVVPLRTHCRNGHERATYNEAGVCIACRRAGSTRWRRRAGIPARKPRYNLVSVRPAP